MAACELREAKRPGGAGRHHYYRSVLRDLLGNLWECTHRHANQDEAQACSGVELQRRIESGEVKPGRRRP